MEERNPKDHAKTLFEGKRGPRPVDELDLLHSRLIDEEYTLHSFYGSRKMVVFLKTRGHIISCKWVQLLMRAMGLAAIVPGPIPAARTLSIGSFPTCCVVFRLLDLIRSGIRISGM